MKVKKESPGYDGNTPPDKHTGKEPKKIRQRRDSTISFRVSRSQRERIESLAGECGMRLSDYVLSRACGYKPKMRLTPEQADIREQLVIARSDYARYTAMLNSMPQDRRKEMFRDQPWMVRTLRLLGMTAERITRILKKHFQTNRMPPSGTVTKDETPQ